MNIFYNFKLDSDRGLQRYKFFIFKSLFVFFFTPNHLKIIYLLIKFSEILANWYDIHKRDLPWRDTRNPYKIWISEIILQQTRVNQGLDYYKRFIEKYPDVNVLANSSQDDVMLSWQGLGYYSRARNLHHAAKQIVNDFDGKFPDTFKEIISLKGVGDYTASAIASFAYELPHPVVDGNVLRFISRYLGIKDPINASKAKEKIKVFLEKQIVEINAATFNQAIMEIGALQCVPQNPVCNECPFKNECMAFKNDLVDSLPNKKYAVKVKDRFFNYFILIYKQKDEYYTILNHRQTKDIWQGLHEFILVEKEHLLSIDEVNESLKEFKIRSVVGFSSDEIVHKLSHRNIKTKFFVRIIEDKAEILDHFSTKFRKLSNFAFPRLISKFLTDYEEQIENLLNIGEQIDKNGIK